MSVDGYRHYSAPKSHGESFADPSIGEAGGLLRSNLRVLAGHPRSWQQLRRDARMQMVSDAVRYSSAYRDVQLPANRDDAPIVMAGHQPSLFHPGVWFKNFALDALGQQHRAVAINLVIDNDVASGSSIRVPSIDSASGDFTYKTIRFDRFGGGVPYEQTVIADRDRFDHFDQAVLQAVSPIVPNPLISKLWKHARYSVERCGVAGCALAQARHALEGEIGLNTLEIPLGAICRSPSFSRFLLMILSEMPRFREIYNSEAGAYRRAHGIRSASHPVPNLSTDDGWCEVPIWIYSDQYPQRKAGWVKRTDSHWILSNRNGLECRLAVGESPERSAEALSHLNTPAFKIRPRALLTTMYARLVLSDLFLHGIGGGKYDQLGDRIAKGFFGIDPPPFMVVSATLQLPGDSPSDLDATIRQLQQAIRQCDYQGERFAETTALDQEWIRRKAQLLREIPVRGQKRQWHQQITQINQQLAHCLQSKKAEMTEQLAERQRQRLSLSILKSREHPFCIFPLDPLIAAYQELLAR
ncbi:FlxA-like family protein [Novipirellula artificiosorum]|uniref:Uncharacterized protein n=1 Tax=Novipirellula artificiosorum TaxID=2528016 RepID=A0A5C6D358_9BACT|nr:FlxA-like family protein [Novipirellula artificiosorum]TWU30555.1 hypothetical protein Poly41_66500 [Novipirellula artificiosorum]